MFKTTLNWFGFTILVSVLLIFIGCDGSESGIEYQEEAIAVELTAYDSMDSSSDPTFKIDVKRDVCGTPDEKPETPEEPNESDKASVNIEELPLEPFYDTIGKATFNYVFYCPDCPSGAYETYIIDSYTVEYIPLQSPDTEGGYFFPPQLASLDNRPIFNQLVLSNYFKTAERSIILISVYTKNEFQEKSNSQGTLLTGALYDVRVHFYGRNRSGGSFNTTSDLQVTFGNYDNCDS